MNTKKQLQAEVEFPESLLSQLVGTIENEHDLSNVVRHLTKQLIERSLNAELSSHIDDEKAECISNSRNGYMSKTLKGELSEMQIQTPRDRSGTFSPILVRKGRLTFQPLTSKYYRCAPVA